MRRAEHPGCERWGGSSHFDQYGICDLPCVDPMVAARAVIPRADSLAHRLVRHRLRSCDEPNEYTRRSARWSKADPSGFFAFGRDFWRGLFSFSFALSRLLF